MKRILDLYKTPYGLSIKRGLTLATPFLILGSFALLLNSFPHEGYQAALEGAAGGRLSVLLEYLYNVTLGSLALILLITISISFGQMVQKDEAALYPVTAVCAYLSFCGGLQEQSAYVFASDWVFSAMCIALISGGLLRKLMQMVHRIKKLHTIGADYIFNLTIKGLLPIALICILFGIVGLALRSVIDTGNITNFGSYLFLKLFSGIGKNLFGILLYVFFSHLLWFFGIHGTNTLDAVAKQFFEEGVDVNQALIEAGLAPTEIFSKTFLDTFVFVGGCGAALCLVLALFIAAKKSNNRKLAQVASPFVLFNISEIVIFGFPVIFNSAMFIPFLLTPLVLALTSSGAMALGLVPMVSNSVEWTVPVLFSGYQATGSLAGSLLQLFNVAVGTCIYIPFIKRSEKKQTRDFRSSVKDMEKAMFQCETAGKAPELMTGTSPFEYAAKALALDMENAIDRGQVQLHYQIQITGEGKIHGAEALLRWEHPVAGNISPPLLIDIAYEGGFLRKLGLYIVESVCRDVREMKRIYSKDLHISINLSPYQMEDEVFLEEALEAIDRYDLDGTQLVFEITERVLLNNSPQMQRRINRLREKGYKVSIDDFGMGHGSMLYLQNMTFDEVKLDGKLVKQMLDNKRSKDIISGIVKLADDLDFQVVAEYVETQQQRDMLQELGCDIYQGYFYGKAEPLPVFEEKYLIP
ncbi:EAL domain-containing protein [Anaerovorax odorimutans]|uniref:EAL domain-containing protein n=2 Tax=Anaerovorax odorimutans TaxID=109327 RepID=A0ABT1RNW7_9FIRM|nr:EAL domain-containing protein [Anaerovorax odorimutans]